MPANPGRLKDDILLTLPAQCFLYASSAATLIFISDSAYAGQLIETEVTSVGVTGSAAPTPTASSPANPACEAIVLAQPLAAKVTPVVCDHKNGTSILPAKSATTLPFTDAVAELTTATNSAPAERTSGTSPPDIVVTADQNLSKIDPLKNVNVKSFELAQTADTAVLRPIAMAYKRALPEPVRDGLHNFLSNIHEPVVALNYLFQLKPVRAFKTAARFAINSTIGAAGLLDIAKRRPFKLLYYPNGFADTLGYYGVKPGPFLYLPFIGPTTPRDLLGDIVDRSVIPLTLGKLPFAELLGRAPYGTSSTIIRVLDRRVQFDETLLRLRDENASLYVARRRLYFRERQTEINNLHHPATEK